MCGGVPTQQRNGKGGQRIAQIHYTFYSGRNDPPPLPPPPVVDTLHALKETPSGWAEGALTHLHGRGFDHVQEELSKPQAGWDGERDGDRCSRNIGEAGRFQSGHPVGAPERLDVSRRCFGLRGGPLTSTKGGRAATTGLVIQVYD